MNKQEKKAVIEVKRKETETSASLMRRFSRKVKQSNILKRARAAQFHTRSPSKIKIKNHTIRKIERAKQNKLLKKLGKLK